MLISLRRRRILFLVDVAPALIDKMIATKTMLKLANRNRAVVWISLQLIDHLNYVFSFHESTLQISVCLFNFGQPKERTNDLSSTKM